MGSIFEPRGPTHATSRVRLRGLPRGAFLGHFRGPGDWEGRRGQAEEFESRDGPMLLET